MIEKENSIKLVMMGARRDDTGIYTLKADNDHGQDQADVEVVVMVEPSKPRGPMKMNDITADGIFFSPISLQFYITKSQTEII